MKQFLALFAGAFLGTITARVLIDVVDWCMCDNCCSCDCTDDGARVCCKVDDDDTLDAEDGDE